MALTSVETALQGVFDRLAYQRGAFAQVGSGGTDLWERIDAAGDETFENRVKGQNVTDADAALADPHLGEMREVRVFIQDIQAYCAADLGLAGLDAYLTAKRWRVDQRMATIYSEVMGVPLSATNVHPPGDAGASCPGLAMGTLAQGGLLVDGAAVDQTKAGPGVVVARVTAIGTADWTVTTTLKRADASEADIEQVVKGGDNGGEVGDVYLLGAQAVAALAAAGQKVVQVAATAQFAVGQQVLLVEWTGSPPDENFIACEVAEIDTISEDTSLTMVAELLHAYSTGAYVCPLWVDVSAAAGSGGTTGDALAYFAGADRRLRL